MDGDPSVDSYSVVRHHERRKDKYIPRREAQQGLEQIRSDCYLQRAYLGEKDGLNTTSETILHRTVKVWCNPTDPGRVGEADPTRRKCTHGEGLGPCANLKLHGLVELICRVLGQHINAIRSAASPVC